VNREPLVLPARLNVEGRKLLFVRCICS